MLNVEFTVPVRIFKVVECVSGYKCLESYLHKHTAIKPLAFPVPMRDGRTSTETYIMTDDELATAISCAERNVKKFNGQATIAEILEIKKLEYAGKVQDTEQARIKLEAEKLAARASGGGGSSSAAETSSEMETEMTETEAKADCSVGSDDGAMDVDVDGPNNGPKILSAEERKDVELLTAANQVSRNYTQVRGPKIQRYSADGKTLLATYNGIPEAACDPALNGATRPTIKAAADGRTIYQDFRWAHLDRSLPDGTVQDIGESAASRVVRHGLVAMLDLTKAHVVKVFPDMTSAGVDRTHKGPATISTAIKNGSPSGGHYFMMWRDVAPALQGEYTARFELPELPAGARGERVQQLHPVTRALVKEYATITQVTADLKISRRTLKNAIATDQSLKNFRWRMAA
jgi:hypothetical protein